MNADRMYLVQRDGELAFFKNGRVVPRRAWYAAMTDCDRNAHDAALFSQNKIKSGTETLRLIAVLDLFLLLPASIPLRWIAEHDISTGYAWAMDAMNMHNDSASCRNPAPVPSTR